MKVSPSQLARILRVSFQINSPVLIMGSPGIGKSDIVASVCADMGLPLAIRHPVTEESIDYKGLPGFENGTARFFPFADFHALMTAGKPMVCFPDDVGQAAQSTQAALMQMTLAREIGGKKISPEVRFVMASNARKDGAGVAGIITPLLSRFTVLELEPSAPDWVKWAMANGMPVELCAFLRFRPELITTFNPDTARNGTPFACPRTIARLGDWLNNGMTDLAVWEGCAGEAFATEFKAFYDTFKALAGLPDAVLTNPQNAPIPQSPATVYALCGALAHRANPTNFAAIATYGKRLAAEGKKEFETALVIDCTQRNPDCLTTKAYIDWSISNQGLI